MPAIYLARIHRRLAELAELGCLETDDVVPCTEEDLLRLESKLGFRLPGVVRELYLWGGKDLGSVFGGMDVVDFEQQMKHDYRPGARETLEEAGEDPAVLDAQTLIIQIDCDGQFSFVRADQGEDPPVHTHSEQEPTFCSCERLSDYLALMVEQSAGVEEVKLVRAVEDLDDLPRPGQPAAYLEARHLLFAGDLQFATVPDRVFEFKELRSLNLVGKGLIELSPRVAELAFLQRLDLARNSLTSLPMALAELDELEDLDLADNQLSTVIGVLRRLPNLRFCALSGNPLPPEELSQLQSELPQRQFSFDQS
jgi:Leucine rich repeat/SMI1 / KNR4 family (SUKH-1)